jgi:hypothetical protein
VTPVNSFRLYLQTDIMYTEQFSLVTQFGKKQTFFITSGEDGIFLTTSNLRSMLVIRSMC